MKWLLFKGRENSFASIKMWHRYKRHKFDTMGKFCREELVDDKKQFFLWEVSLGACVSKRAVH